MWGDRGLWLRATGCGVAPSPPLLGSTCRFPTVGRTPPGSAGGLLWAWHPAPSSQEPSRPGALPGAEERLTFLQPVPLSFSLGRNSEQGEGNCFWAKVSLAGWKALGLQEEKGTPSCQQVWRGKWGEWSTPADHMGHCPLPEAPLNLRSWPWPEGGQSHSLPPPPSAPQCQGHPSLEKGRRKKTSLPRGCAVGRALYNTRETC